MTLTEKWKKGELEQGWYYIECIDLPKRWIDVDYYRNDCYEDEGFCKGFFDHNDWRGINKVLAPVPSYEEWQKMKEQRDACAWALDKIGDVLVKHKLVKKIDEVLK